MGFYAFTNEDIRIGDFLSESPNNKVIRIKDSYYLVKGADIIQAYPNCIFYKCKSAGNTYHFYSDSNIVKETPPL